VGPVDLVLFTVKSADTRRAAEAIAPVVRDHTTVLAIQNGVENEAILEEVLGAARVVPGVAVIGVSMPEPGHVLHTNNGSITLGEPSGERTDRVLEIERTLSEAGVGARISTDIRSVKWRKLVWNSAFNPIAALTGERVLQLIENDDTRELAEAAMREAVAVGEAMGLGVADYDMDRATQRNPNWAHSKTSMLQDIERGRPTEIDALTGAVVRYGEQVGVPTPVSRTLLRLVRARERGVTRGQ
jgi:2-dehydropantoate 2-reductase